MDLDQALGVGGAGVVGAVVVAATGVLVEHGGRLCVLDRGPGGEGRGGFRRG